MSKPWWPSFLGGGSNAFQETLGANPDRANLRYLLPRDSLLYINKRSRRTLNEHAEWAWQNFGIVKEGVAGIARHTIGKGVSLQLDSDDSKFNGLGEDDFEQYALTPERCDLAGRRNFYEAQTTAIEQRLVRGEFFAVHAQNPEWDNAPCFQLYDSEECASPLDRQKYDNPILDGVELNKNSRAVRYWMRDMEGKFNPFDAAQVVHWYKPHAVNQYRGITDFAQAVNPLVDIFELKRLATRSAKAQQIIAMVMKGVKKSRRRGALGAISQSGVKEDGSPDPNTSQMESMVGAAGGGIVYLDEEFGEVKLVTADSPSPLVETFITDLLMRDVCAGWGVPAEFFWNIAKLNGGNTRFILARADLFFQILGDRLLDRFCRPFAFRYLSHRINSGILKAPTDANWGYKLNFQLPARVTVDNGRENQILIELLAAGLITMREYCNQRGLNYKHVMRQWIREPLEFINLAESEGAPTDYVKRLRDNLPLWRAPAPGTVLPTGADPTGNGTDPSKTQNPSTADNTDQEQQKAA